jgi:hypothetical protein
MPKFELAERIATEAEALMNKSFEEKYKKEWFTKLKNLYYFYFKSLPK